MSRVPLLFGLIAVCLFTAQVTVSQDYDVHVQLYAFAEFPFFSDVPNNGVLYPPISEYKELTDWIQNPYNRIRSPDHFELIAIVSNPGTLAVKSIQLELTKDRKIGELWDFETQLHPREHAQWEGSIQIATRMIDALDGKTATVVRFGPFSASDLQDDLLAQESWPWEVEYEVTVQCSSCDPNSDSTSITMVHSH